MSLPISSTRSGTSAPTLLESGRKVSPSRNLTTLLCVSNLAWLWRGADYSSGQFQQDTFQSSPSEATAPAYPSLGVNFTTDHSGVFPEGSFVFTLTKRSAKNPLLFL